MVELELKLSPMQSDVYTQLCYDGEALINIRDSERHLERLKDKIVNKIDEEIDNELNKENINYLLALEFMGREVLVHYLKKQLDFRKEDLNRMYQFFDSKISEMRGLVLYLKESNRELKESREILNKIGENKK